MGKIKIAHEAPIDIFEEVQRLTDYDYALVHLLEQNPRYRDTFERAVKKGREVILDNSIFELEEAFEADRFALWVERLKPTWYIIPDALENAEKTMEQAANWIKNYSEVPGKRIGVVQGKTYQEIKDCYRAMNELAKVDMIAISFDYSYYRDSVSHPNKYVSWMLGRVKLLGDHGLKGITYGSDGLWSKESQKLHELIDVDIDKIDISLVLNNIQKFRWFTNGQTPVGNIV